MKYITTPLLFLVTLSLTTGTALAHPGHIAAESVHGFLHVEHIILLAAVGLIAYLLKVNNK